MSFFDEYDLSDRGFDGIHVSAETVLCRFDLMHIDDEARSNDSLEYVMTAKFHKNDIEIEGKINLDRPFLLSIIPYDRKIYPVILICNGCYFDAPREQLTLKIKFRGEPFEVTEYAPRETTNSS